MSTRYLVPGRMVCGKLFPGSSAFFLMCIFIVLSQQLSGAAMAVVVSLHPPAASMESRVRFL